MDYIFKSIFSVKNGIFHGGFYSSAVLAPMAHMMFYLMVSSIDYPIKCSNIPDSHQFPNEYLDGFCANEEFLKPKNGELDKASYYR